MEDENVVVRYSLNPTWKIVKNIRNKITSLLKSQDKDLMDSITMTSSELIENAVKYGKTTPDGDAIDFELMMSDTKVVIKVSNGVISEKDFENVKEHMDRIEKTDNPGELYTQRLMELMENPKPGVSQLGLYRIAYEAEFKLSYNFENEILTVIAERLL